jgi:hypothetical protein
MLCCSASGSSCSCHQLEHQSRQRKARANGPHSFTRFLIRCTLRCLHVCVAFHALFLQGGSEEAGSMKARADRAKKLADYDRRLQESKENVAFWMNQIKTIVDVGARAMPRCLNM